MDPKGSHELVRDLLQNYSCKRRYKVEFLRLEGPSMNRIIGRHYRFKENINMTIYSYC